MAIAPKSGISSLSERTSDFTHVYFCKKGSDAYSTPDFEFPVIEGSINYGLGEVDFEYVKLVSGGIWASKMTKGDPDVSFQVATNNKSVAELFGSVSTGSIFDGKGTIEVDMTNIKVTEGTVIFTDDSGNAEILPDCKLTAARGKDSMVYWNVKVTPGDKVIITTSES